MAHGLYIIDILYFNQSWNSTFWAYLWLAIGHSTAKRKKGFSSQKKWKDIGWIVQSVSQEKGRFRDSFHQLPKWGHYIYHKSNGHWKRSFPKYMHDLNKKKVKECGTSTIFIIDFHTTSTSNSWVLVIR